MEGRDGMQNGVAAHFRSPELERRWKSLCSRVLAEFFPLPEYRLLCFFDTDQLYWCAPSVLGNFFPDLGRCRKKKQLPFYIDDTQDAKGRVFDVLIHISGSTCCANEPVLYVMALAHELRHFVQWASRPDLYRDPLRMLGESNPMIDTEAWSVPVERDAIIFSKRVAETLNGPDSVKKYADVQVKAGHYKLYWEFFHDLSSSADYDWIKETEPGKRLT